MLDKNLNLSNEDGKAKISQGKIIVIDPKENGKPAKIRCSENYKIYINDILITEDSDIFADNNIKIEFPSVKGERKIKITSSNDNMKAYISVQCTPEVTYIPDDCEECNVLTITPKKIDEKYTMVYKFEDIIEELHKNKIKCGIIEDNIKKNVGEHEINSLLVAEGIEAIDGEDDYIDFKFNIDEDIKSFKEDDSGRIDFKSIGSIESVKKGQIVAVKISGKEGKNGSDIYGNEKKCKTSKRLKLKVGQGCKLQDDNTVVAAIDGRPFLKNNTFYIYQVYNVDGDVDINTGNINFIGDICISGDVKEGMKVKAGNSVEIAKSVERADISAKGNITIKENVISSRVIGGGEDISTHNRIQDYNKLALNLKTLIDTIEEVKKFNLLGYDSSDGQIIKVLIENKFKEIPKCCANIIKDFVLCLEKEDEDEEIVSFIKSKLRGLGPLEIKSYGEIYDFMTSLEQRVDALKLKLAIPVDVKLYYCQESNVISSGNIVISGKGSYVSDIYAQDSICFIDSKSVLRGGTVKAGKEIRCSTVGSQSGVTTKLVVSEKGHIFADIVYENTLFVVGTREYKIDEACKSVHVYLDESSDIVVDKFKL